MSKNLYDVGGGILKNFAPLKIFSTLPPAVYIMNAAFLSVNCQLNYPKIQEPFWQTSKKYRFLHMSFYCTEQELYWKLLLKMEG